MTLRNFAYILLAVSTLALSGCLVGPNYQRPSAPTPPSYKEEPPASFNETNGFTKANPSDDTIRGKWWEIYNDPALNAFEEQVSISNQNVLAYAAQYAEARDVVKVARTNLFPTVTGSVGITNSRNGSIGVTSAGALQGGTSIRTLYTLPGDVSWTADIWGSVRRTIRADIANAQALAAQVENARLSYQALLAEDYFRLHGVDSDEDLLQRTVASYEQYFQLTQDRFEAGIASDADVASAEALLEAARASLIDLQTQRAQYEHAIAVLTGKPPEGFSVEKMVLKNPPPAIPTSVPSKLLERRPDIAQFERQVAAANEEIGVAKAAFYPTISLSASAGFNGNSITNWLTWPSRFWSVGPSASEVLFDAGRRRAQVAEFQHAYEATVADYRQTVLTAFQQVEDYLVELRVLENEAVVQERAVAAAQRFLDVATEQYKAGVADYLTVITAQTTTYSDERAATDILTNRIYSSVLLIEALGGGWNASSLPTAGMIAKGQ